MAITYFLNRSETLRRRRRLCMVPLFLVMLVATGCGKSTGAGSVAATIAASSSPSADTSPPLAATSCAPPAVASPGTSASITCLTSPARTGSHATIKAHARPGTPCSVMVYAGGSGFSRAEGLTIKSTDGSGGVSWDWLVDLKPGKWTVQAFCAEGTSATAELVVVK